MVDLLLLALCIFMGNLQCLATLQSTAVPPHFTRIKAFSCQKAPIWSQRKRLHCSPSLHLSSTTPSSCCAGLAARRGFLFWFLCWRSKFLGMWNQRRCCHVSPDSFFNPPGRPFGPASSLKNGRADDTAGWSLHAIIHDTHARMQTIRCVTHWNPAKCFIDLHRPQLGCCCSVLVAEVLHHREKTTFYQEMFHLKEPNYSQQVRTKEKRIQSKLPTNKTF